jgi:hypothetical protein
MEARGYRVSLHFSLHCHLLPYHHLFFHYHFLLNHGLAFFAARALASGRCADNGSIGWIATGALTSASATVTYSPA